MNKMRMIKIRRLLYIIIIILELLFFGYLKLNEYFLHHLSNYTSTIPDDGIISFSIEPGIYDHSITVDLKNELELINKDVKILYSLDGNDPYYNNSYLSEEKETIVFNPYEYSESIKIDVNEKSIVVVPIKAVVYYNGQYSKVVEKTYIVSDGDINQYTDLPIISITANHHDLYDYYDGMLAVGYGKELLAEQENPIFFLGNVALEKYANGSAYFYELSNNKVDYYDNITLNLGGQSSLQSPIKSFKMKSNNGRFIIDNFSNKNDHYVNEYKTLKLRGGSQDLFNTNIRSSLASDVAYEFNADLSYNTKQVVMYLNNDFYGIMDIQDNYSPSNIKRRYNIPDDNIEEIKNSYSVCELPESLNSDGFYNYIENNYDIDNLLEYIAVETYINNTDWPKSNNEKWRYLGSDNKNNKYTDGKYRFLMFDVDMMWWNDTYPLYFLGVDGENLVNTFNNVSHSECDLISELLKNETLRNKLIVYLSDIIYMMEKDDFIYNKVENEFNNISKSLDFYSEKVSGYDVKKMEYNLNEMISVIRQRPRKIDEIITKLFGYNDKYTLSIKTNNGVSASWNNMIVEANSIFKNDYYMESDFEITANSNDEYKFNYWIINGKIIKQNTINPSDYIQNGKVSIECVSYEK